MPSPFAAATQAAAAAVDAIMGETFTFRPMKRQADVSARPVIDPDRLVRSGVVAIFGEPSARLDSGAVRTPGVKPEHPGHATSRPFVSLSRSRLPYAPEKDDIVIREATGVRYMIAEVLPSTPGFVRLDLNELRSPS